MAFALPDIATENTLLLRVRRGDRSAISVIYERYFASIYTFVRMRVEDTRAAEDISSEVFMRLIDTIGTRTGPQKTLRGWLFQVARNEIYRFFGRPRDVSDESVDEWLSNRADEDSEDLESRFIRNMDSERARQALKMLSSEQQEVLMLRFGEGLNLQETADVMGKRLGAIKSLQFRAVETLRQILGELQGAG